MNFPCSDVNCVNINRLSIIYLIKINIIRKFSYFPKKA